MRAPVLLALLGTACSAATPPAPTDAPAPPTKADEAGFQLAGPRSYYLVGDALTPGDDLLEIEVATAQPVDVVDLWIDRSFAGRAFLDGGAALLTADISDLPPGEHEILLAADGAPFAFAQRFFRRS
ncbi:MAG TPA: hypothetical protein VKZ63_01885, partial [Kofleriaceae bacterium]|nr:hypothetical protein [Kofleriaceae bacterium]